MKKLEILTKRNLRCIISKSDYRVFTLNGLNIIRVWFVDNVKELTKEDLKKSNIYFIKNSNYALEKVLKKSRYDNRKIWKERKWKCIRRRRKHGLDTLRLPEKRYDGKNEKTILYKTRRKRDKK